MLSSSLVVFLDGWLVNLDTLSLDDIAHASLETDEILRRESIGFCDNRNEVDTCAKTFHDLDVEGLQCMSGGSNEVQASVNSEINLIVSSWLLFLQHV